MSDNHEILTPFVLDPEVIFGSYTMFINAHTKKFTLAHLVNFTIVRTCIRVKNMHSFMDATFMNELIVKYKVSTCQWCHYTYSNHVMLLHWVLLIIISNLQFTTSKRAISIDIIWPWIFVWLLAKCTFCSISIWILFHFLLLILSCSLTIVQHLRLDYCKNFEQSGK